MPVMAQVTAQRIMDAVSSDEIPALIQEINSLPAGARQASAAEVVQLTAREFASNREYHDGKRLLTVLPQIADDQLLARSLRPYLENQDATVRRVAFEALSHGTGAAVGALLSSKIEAIFGRMPTLPFQAADETRAREANDNAVYFADCLKGLLRSDSNSARDVGARYFALFRSRYSGSIEGQQIIKGLEQELTRAGLTIDSAASPALSEPKPPPSARTALIPALPTATPAFSTPTPKVAESAAPVVERKSPVWPWVVGGILAIVVIVALVLKRRA